MSSVFNGEPRPIGQPRRPRDQSAPGRLSSSLGTRLALLSFFFPLNFRAGEPGEG